MAASRQIDTGTEDLLARVEDGVAILTMNRPERLNAWTIDMAAGMTRALTDAERAEDVGCVVVTGTGRAFCAGGDVKDMAARGGQPRPEAPANADLRVREQALVQRETSGRIYEMRKPVLGSLPGAAAGAGLSIALACDMRIASENAVLTTAFAKVGVSGDYGGIWFLSRLVGPAKARELFYFSDRLDAKQAQQLGLVNWVVPESALAERTMELARKLASGPRLAYRYIKENFKHAERSDLFAYMDIEVAHFFETSGTEDNREAARAFVEKREPRFKGR